MGIGVAVGAYALLRDLEPIGLDEHCEFGVVVPCVLVLETRVGVVAFAQKALGFIGGGGVVVKLHRLAKRAMEGALVLEAIGAGDGGD